MIKDEFIAWDRGSLEHPSTVISWRCLTAAPGSDASAIHGRLDARVALLQSPILPAAILLYPGKELFRNLPVDKPHTCSLEPFKPETPKTTLYLVLAQGRLTLQVVWLGLPHFQLLLLDSLWAQDYHWSMKYRVTLIEHEEGVSVSCPALRGCHSQGKTREEALANIQEAIREWLAAEADEAKLFKVSEAEVAI
jgi:predicted RNase H-like HicB family nuclease